MIVGQIEMQALLNSDTAKALAAGETIQSYDPATAKWSDVHRVYLFSFLNNPERYRVKTEPRERWVSGGFAFEEKKKAKEHANSYGSEIIHMREVQ